MQHKKSTQTNVIAVTNRGLLVGIPVLISLVFSALYTLTQTAHTGPTTSSKQSSQRAAKPKNIEVITPPAATKLNTSAPTPTNLNRSKVKQADGKSTNQTPSEINNNASNTIQKSTQQPAEQSSKESLLKLQTKTKL